jgi:hypothetical protein
MNINDKFKNNGEKKHNLNQGKKSLGRGLLKYKKEIIITQP